MSFRTLFDIPFGIPNVYVLAPEKPLTASPHRSATVGSPVGRGGGGPYPLGFAALHSKEASPTGEALISHTIIKL